MFEWDQGNADHIAEHRVSTAEAEEALLDRRRIYDHANQTSNEQRWAVIGATEAGRVLFVVFTRRGRLVRVVTARDALARERRRYRS